MEPHRAGKVLALICLVLLASGGAAAVGIPLHTSTLVVEVEADTPLGPLRREQSIDLLFPAVPNAPGTLVKRAEETGAPEGLAPLLTGGQPDSEAWYGHDVGTYAVRSNSLRGAVPLLPDDSFYFRTGVLGGYFHMPLPTPGSGRFHVTPADFEALLQGGTGASSHSAATLATAGLPHHEAPALSSSPLLYSPSTPADGEQPPASKAPPVRASTARGADATPGGFGATPHAIAAGAAATGLLGFLGYALYHRIKGHSTLENATRKSIYDAVCAKPGVGVQEIAEVAGVSYSTAAYHLDRLVDAHMIVLHSAANKLCYYKNGGSFNEDERKMLPILKNAEAMRILEKILERPGTYRAELAGALDVTPTTINWHLKRLVEAGLVSESRSGRNAYLYPNRERLEAAIAPIAEKLAADAGLEGGAAARRVLELSRPVPA